jgi:hypothetical protein
MFFSMSQWIGRFSGQKLQPNHPQYITNALTTYEKKSSQQTLFSPKTIFPFPYFSLTDEKQKSNRLHKQNFIRQTFVHHLLPYRFSFPNFQRENNLYLRALFYENQFSLGCINPHLPSNSSFLSTSCVPYVTDWKRLLTTLSTCSMFFRYAWWLPSMGLSIVDKKHHPQIFFSIDNNNSNNSSNNNDFFSSLNKPKKKDDYLLFHELSNSFRSWPIVLV